MNLDRLLRAADHACNVVVAQFLAVKRSTSTSR
jgi:hypothetical protein